MSDRIQPLALPLAPGDELTIGETTLVLGHRVHSGCNRFHAERNGEAVEIHLDDIADLASRVDQVTITKAHARREARP